MTAPAPLLRIGELSRRTGVSAELLRAWERRYELLQPIRSSGGLRLYTHEDVERVTLMQQHLADGLAAAEAAEAVLRATVAPEAGPELSWDEARRALTAALDDFDESAAQAVIDRLLSKTTLETLLSEVVLPYLHELGDRWARGDASVAQEHFATAIVRGRLLGMARGWGVGIGPAAVLACLPGEQHDLGLLAFGLALRARGWRIVYLGPDTPLDTVQEACERVQPSLVVLSALSAERVTPVARQISKVAARHQVALGGAGATGATKAKGVLVLAGDPVAEAARVTELAA